MPRSIQEINEKIKAGKAVVVTAEEMTGIVKKADDRGGRDLPVEKEMREVEGVKTVRQLLSCFCFKAGKI